MLKLQQRKVSITTAIKPVQSQTFHHLAASTESSLDACFLCPKGWWVKWSLKRMRCRLENDLISGFVRKQQCFTSEMENPEWRCRKWKSYCRNCSSWSKRAKLACCLDGKDGIHPHFCQSIVIYKRADYPRFSVLVSFCYADWSDSWLLGGIWQMTTFWRITGIVTGSKWWECSNGAWNVNKKTNNASVLQISREALMACKGRLDRSMVLLSSLKIVKLKKLLRWR